MKKEEKARKSKAEKRKKNKKIEAKSIKKKVFFLVSIQMLLEGFIPMID